MFVIIIDNPQFRFVKADICDRGAVHKLFEGSSQIRL